METAPNPKKEFLAYEEYNKQGDLYVAAQRKFYTDVPDTGRKFFRGAVEQNISEKEIADMGCGAGDDLVTYQSMGAKKVIGIEPSIVMLKAAEETLQQKGVSIELKQGDWNAIPLPDESVDVVTSRYSFHIIPDFEKAFKEVARVLKHSGHFLIAVPHPLYDKKLAQEQGAGPTDTIKSTLFGGEVTVENFQHSMEDYTGDMANKYFTVEKVMEYSMNERLNESEPTALLVDYKKK